MLPFFLLPPEIQEAARRAQQEKAEAEAQHFEEVLAPAARTWIPTIEKPHEDVCYSAASFSEQLYRPFSLSVARPTEPSIDPTENDQVCDIGEPNEENRKYNVQWVYRNALLPRGSGLTAYPYKRKNVKVYFDADISIPVLYRFRPWLPDSGYRMRVWMNMTPMEFFTLRPALRFATSKVLVAGLGLGLVLRMIAEKRTVPHIILVERSEELLDWFGYDLISEIEDSTGTYIEVINDDVYAYLAKEGTKHVSRMIFDIWDGWYEARHDKNFQQLYDQHRRKIWFWGARMLT